MTTTSILESRTLRPKYLACRAGDESAKKSRYGGKRASAKPAPQRHSSVTRAFSAAGTRGELFMIYNSCYYGYYGDYCEYDFLPTALLSPFACLLEKFPFLFLAARSFAQSSLAPRELSFWSARFFTPPFPFGLRLSRQCGLYRAKCLGRR